ncbi:uncharacterized protein LOC122851909 [Aphidius gifuensis]|uniref:uncharacterized protein LOC122851909 n=1 Tax=Aphidius gifuensis TaxID=684658 RepID=UPI001CDC2603|nr:uncharacterized protein LOC122851909 [Aphidius gifuensis]
MQFYKFVSIMWILYRRFNHLYKLTVRKDSNKQLFIGMMEKKLNDVKVEDAISMHYNLFTAAKKLNSLYSIELFLMVTGHMTNLVYQVHSLLERIKDNKVLTFGNYSWLGILFACFHLFIITASCHFTSWKANKISEEIFSAYSSINNTAQDNSRSTMYFHKKKLNFTSLNGLFNVDLPLLMSLIGASTTLLVVLLK